MAFSKNKLKILYIMKALLEKSDENNVLSAEDLNNILKTYGYSVDRKTVYSDIETLEEFGLDIVQIKGGTKAGYYIGSRAFELPELKLLVDAVQSSKFITVKKSNELIRKIEKLACENDAKELQRNVFVHNRLKADNETIYYNVDGIHNGILHNKQIRFQYTEWNVKKELVAKRDGTYYVVSPWALTWDDENYYLIGYEEETEKIKHYRVDKMRNTTIIEEPRLGKESFEHFDLATFAKKTFGMYGGEDETVRLLCKKEAIGIILDRFSKEVAIIPKDKESFYVNVTVSISPQFFGWITGLGGKVYIDGSQHIKEEYKEFLQNILGEY